MNPKIYLTLFYERNLGKYGKKRKWEGKKRKWEETKKWERSYHGDYGVFWRSPTATTVSIPPNGPSTLGWKREEERTRRKKMKNTTATSQHSRLEERRKKELEGNRGCLAKTKGSVFF
ncbi:MAG: hypothetical protein Q8835_02920 [Sweet potato little leaf phytoplasma]|nr:hypothetical protein [Sweet potato little leaf phytoplasma]